MSGWPSTRISPLMVSMLFAQSSRSRQVLHRHYLFCANKRILE